MRYRPFLVSALFMIHWLPWGSDDGGDGAETGGDQGDVEIRLCALGFNRSAHHSER